jgi:hypothetical protein
VNPALLSSLRARVLPIARVLALLGALLAPGLWLGMDALHARASELIDDTGASMLAYAAQGRLEGAHTLLLNGLRLRMQVGTTRDPAERVLAVFAGRCRARSGGVALQLQEGLHGRLPAKLVTQTFDPVLQLGDARGGFVGCLDLGAQRVLPADLLARLSRFARAADVAEIGALRFAWARSEGRDTRYVALWSDQPLPLRSAFPALGDAPGSDVPRVPRPSATRRVLSAWQEGAAPMLVAYASAQPAPAALRGYEPQLRARGYRLQRGVSAHDDAPWWLASRAEQSVAVIAAAHGSGSLLLVAPLR